MSITGNPDTEQQAADSPDNVASHVSLLRQRFFLLLAAVGLVAAAYVGVQLFGIIYGLIFPPEAPVPSDALLIEHENFAYGVDEWLYGTQTTACDLVTFYLENGANCRLTPGQCGTGVTSPLGQTIQNVATCRGRETFSIFEMAWETTIAAGYRTGDPTRFRVRREVFWIGTASTADEAD